jgi:sigma-B regulation protein RsbU (phosphoserine phosphatase)
MQYGLIRALSGRAIVIGAVVKIAIAALGLVTPVPRALGVLDTLASIAIAAGGLYFLSRAVALANERLLWRLRHKLIISYIFIGFIPAFLIVAFFLLVGLILFSTFSSYLVQSRLQVLSDHVGGLADSIALEIQRSDTRELADLLARRQSVEARAFPRVSIAVAPLARSCRRSAEASEARTGALTAPVTVGAWSHMPPPTVVPEWIGCDGFRGLLAYSAARADRGDASDRGRGVVPSSLVPSGDRPPVGLIVRAVGFPLSAAPGYGVIVDLVVDATVKRQLWNDSGVELEQVTQVFGGDVGTLVAGTLVDGDAGRPSSEAALPFSSVSFLTYRDWTTGRTGSLLVSLKLSVVDIYERLSEAERAPAHPGDGQETALPRGLVMGRRSFGEGLLLVLVGIGALLFIIEIAAFVTGLMLARSITGSVHELFAGTERVRRGDFTYKIAIRVRDQLGELAASFNSMTASIGGLLRDAEEKKRLEEELRIAHEIQMSLLPSAPLNLEGISVSALCVPAREVGGDYYDFLVLDNERLGVLIADVSGKGTSAALYMAELKGLMLSLSRIHTSPRELLIDANRIIAAHLDARSFITMTYAIVDLRARTMTYARAGHTPLMYQRAADDVPRGVQTAAPEGMVLGLKLDRGETFERLLREETVAIRDGDLYVFFTDGITEAMNVDNDCFGEARLSQLIEDYGHLPSEELRERVIGAIRDFVGQAPQHDDMTLILLRIGERQHVGPRDQAETAGALGA